MHGQNHKIIELNSRATDSQHVFNETRVLHQTISFFHADFVAASKSAKDFQYSSIYLQWPLINPIKYHFFLLPKWRRQSFYHDFMMHAS